jgi:hypothetical protein
MRLSPALAWRQPAYKVRGVGANLRRSNDQSMYQSSACSGVLYVARYLFLNILLGIPLTAILMHFRISDNFGYAITNNASENTVCLDHLSELLKVDLDKRCVMYIGHVINLVA